MLIFNIQIEMNLFSGIRMSMKEEPVGRVGHHRWRIGSGTYTRSCFWNIATYYHLHQVAIQSRLSDIKQANQHRMHL